MKPLIVYYSYGGNTRRIADLIQEKTGADVAELEAVSPYTGSYDAIVAQGKREADSGFEPEIKPLSVRIANYDTIILGTPVWWYTFAPAVKTFLSAQDWSGKVVYPYATNGGWLGHTFEDIEKLCSGATVQKGLNVRFDTDQLQTAEEDINRWAQSITE